MKLTTHLILVRRYDGETIVRGLAKVPIALQDDEVLVTLDLELPDDVVDALLDLPPEHRQDVHVAVGRLGRQG